MKGSAVETIEYARKEYKQLLEERWKKTSIFNSYVQQKVGTFQIKVLQTSAFFARLDIKQ